ncbi:MAG: oligosaccharide flippase family protein [Polyangiales bacterium]
MDSALNRLRAKVDGVRAMLRAVLRAEGYDTSTEEGRAMERYRRAALSSLTSALSQALMLLTGFVSIRLTLGYLGRKQYGLWMAASALLTWAQLADFGLAKGVQSHLAEAYARDDREAASRYVATGFGALVAIACALALVVAPGLYVIPWTRVLNVDDPALAAQTRVVVGAVVAVFLCNFPLSLVGTIYNAHQRAYVGNLFQACGHVLSLIAVVTITQLRLPMPWLIAGTGGVQVTVAALSLAWLFRLMPWLRPTRERVSKSTLTALASVSLPMLLFQLGSLFINEAQFVIIAQRVRLEAVADFTLLMQVYAIPLGLVSTIDGPLTAAFREAHVRGDRGWVETTFRRMLRLKAQIAALSIVGYFVVGNLFVRLLSDRSVEFSAAIWAATAVHLVVALWNISFTDLVIATNRLWPLVYGILANALGTIALSWLLAGRLGLLGVIAAMPVFSVLVTGWLYPFTVRDLFAKRE